MSTDDQQKRGGLVPIGTVAVRWAGCRGARGAPCPRGRGHHFTTLRQVNQLIEASEAEPELGFYGAVARPLLAAPGQTRGTAKSTCAATGRMSWYSRPAAGRRGCPSATSRACS